MQTPLAEQINKLVAALKVDYGAGAVMFLDEAPEKVNVIPTGVLPLDIITGIGGFPCGRIIELYGPPSSGKSTTALHVCANAQKKFAKPILYLDYEHAVDKRYARAIGVDLGGFILSQPESFEQGLAIADKFMINNLVSAVLVDSVAAMTTEEELKEEHWGHSRPMIQAAVMAAALRQLTHRIAVSDACMIFINQIREKVDMTPFGRKMGIKRKGTPGGDAMKFYASMRIEFRAISGMKGKIIDNITGEVVDAIVATVTNVKIVKNKLAPPFREAEFVMRYGIGVDHILTTMNIALKRGILVKQKAGYVDIPPQCVESGEAKRIQGNNAVWQYFHDNDCQFKELLRIVNESIERTMAENVGVTEQQETTELGEEVAETEALTT